MSDRRPDDGVVEYEGMSAAAVLEVSASPRSIGCRFWLEGGWGVDALVCRKTRPHRDVEVDFGASLDAEVLEALDGSGNSIETDEDLRRCARPGGAILVGSAQL